MAGVDKIRFGLIGCGRIARSHVQAFAEHAAECELVAVCDSDAARAKRIGDASGAVVCADYAQMLNRDDLDAISICTPSGLHPEQGVMAAEARKHVVTEKPMAIDLAGCDELIDSCERSGVRLFVVKQNRLHTTMRLLKRAVDRGRFGKVFGAYVNVFWQRPQRYYDSSGWRGTWAADGGAFMNQASHYVDSLCWLFGEVESVMAMTGTLGRQIEAEDSGSAVLKFRNGAIGSINVSMLVYPKNLEGSITVIGENGTARVGGTAVNRFERWEFAEYDDDDRIVAEFNHDPPDVYGHGIYYRNVIDVLNGRSTPNTDGRSGRSSIELILAIYKSAREGVRVALPLEV